VWLVALQLVSVSWSGCGGGDGSRPLDGGAPDSGAAATTPPFFLTDPEDRLVVAPAGTQFSVSVGGDPDPEVTWETSDDEGATWESVPAVSGTELDFESTTPSMDGLRVRARATNTAGTATSAAATLQVQVVPSAPVVLEDPEDTTVPAGAAATFHVEVSGYPSPTFQWQRAPAGSEAFVDMPSATAATLETPPAIFVADDDGPTDRGARYRVVVTNSEGVATSAAATLTVTAAPLTQFVHVEAGARQHVLGLRADGSVWSWGGGVSGTGRSCGSCAPRPVPGLTGRFVAIHARAGASFAVHEDGTVWSWGYNGAGVLGRGVADGAAYTTPGVVVRADDGEPLTGIVGVTMSRGDGSVLAWTEAGVVWTWGSAWIEPGQSYVTAVRLAAVPHPRFDGTTPERSLAWVVSGSYVHVGVNGAGDGVYWWHQGGALYSDVLPLSGLGIEGVPRDVAMSETGEGAHPRLAVVDADGVLYHQAMVLSGANDIAGANNLTLVEQDLPEPIARVAAAPEPWGVVAIGESGAGYAVGVDVSGQLGDGTVGGGARTTYAPVLDLAGAADVAVLREGVVGVRHDGTVFGWGDAAYFTLGAADSAGRPILSTGWERYSARAFTLSRP